MMLTNLIKDKTIILASQSPRRKELLSGIVDDFKTEVRSVDEVFPDGLTNGEIAVYLSELKAQAFKEDVQQEEVIITADTIVCIGSKVLGKPKDKTEAIKMLKGLSGNTHEVITGVTLLTNTQKLSFYDKTLVTFYELSDEEIDFYIEQHQPFDKAGSYGIQEWIGYIGIKEMKGDYYNVMGLPLHLLYRKLQKFILEEGN
ncbi:MAG: Maf family nucleotide pyrophosphatase [Flavobacteriales bacterium]|jgi:septum formation protein|nr:Maf family nucleotide pyrophosphatase [Flavobacteriales bacterium]